MGIESRDLFILADASFLVMRWPTLSTCDHNTIFISHRILSYGNCQLSLLSVQEILSILKSREEW